MPCFCCFSHIHCANLGRLAFICISHFSFVYFCYCNISYLSCYMKYYFYLRQINWELFLFLGLTRDKVKSYCFDFWFRWWLFRDTSSISDRPHCSNNIYFNILKSIALYLQIIWSNQFMLRKWRLFPFISSHFRCVD